MAQPTATAANKAKSANPKPAIAPKPPAQRRSIFATAVAGGKEGLVACSICERNFASDRIEKHESICAKTKAKKRKVFDITKMRVKGTEAECFVLNQPKSFAQISTNANANAAHAAVGQKKKASGPVNLTEAFNSAILSSKTVKSEPVPVSICFPYKLNSI